MKARGAAVHGVLAVGALVAAWATFKRPPEQAQGEVVVLEASKSTLERIRYDDGLRWVELTRERAGEGPAWVKTGGFEQRPVVPDAGTAPAADGGTADGGLAVPPPVPQLEKVALPTREMRGSDRAEKAYERFAPLRAARALGKLADDKRKEIGLDNTHRRLQVTAGGVTHAFRVGGSSFGVGNPYLESEKDGHVYLLQGMVLSELDPAAQALVERRLHTFKPTEFDELVVKAGNKQRAFVQKDATDFQTKLAPKENPDKPDELARNWHEKVWSRFFVSEVYGKGEKLPNGEPEVKLRLDYFRRGELKGWLELGTLPVVGQGAHLPGTTAHVYARSENTAGWVLLHPGAEEVVSEASKVVGGTGS